MKCAKVFLLVLMAFSSSADAQERLRLHGSNTIGERLAPELVESWLTAEGYRDIRRVALAPQESEIHASRADGDVVVELHAHGSSTGFKDLANGAADIAMASRPAVAADAAPGVGRLDSAEQEVVIALDGLAIIVHPGNPLRSLTKAQLRDLFSGAAGDWSSVGRLAGPVALHARDEKSGTWESFRTLVLGSSPLSPRARRYESTSELAAAVAADPNAIGFVGLVGVRGVRALAIADGGAPVAPSAEEVAVEDYPLSRRLFLYTRSEATPLVRAFLDFAVGSAGQNVVESVGFVSQNIRAYAAAMRTDAPEEYLQLVKGARRLSLNFRFAEGSAELDSKAERDLDRLARYMRGSEQRGQALLLMGFSDAGETLPYLSLSLSNERVDLVADRLAVRGVNPARSRGMGGAAPVASNDSPQGRHRNRRVEVWVGERALPSSRSASARAAD